MLPPKCRVPSGVLPYFSSELRNSVIQKIPPDTDLTTRDESVPLNKQRGTVKWPDTHLVSESLFGTKLTLAVTGSLSGMGRVEAEAQRSWVGTHSPCWVHGPRAEGKGQLTLDGGAGAGSPRSSLRETHGSACLLSRRTQHS